MSQEAAPGDDAPVPEVIAAYAAYVRGKTGAEPVVTVDGDTAGMAVIAGGRALVLAFALRRAEWRLDRAEVRHGEQVTAFTRGRLPQAVAALLVSP